MKQADRVIQSVQFALQPGGRFGAEFGGKGNVQTIIQGITEGLSHDYGIDAAHRNPWYFPSIGEYSALLEKVGLQVIDAHYFDRPTPLPDQEDGWSHWLDGFAESFFPEFSQEEKRIIYRKIGDKIKSELWKNGSWVVDYKRIQIVAVKPNQ